MMLLITILLFGKLRQTAVIWTVVPMAVNGAAIGLLVTGLTRAPILISLSCKLVNDQSAMASGSSRQRRNVAIL